ncbi:MBL fold metallo-hydrolase, partial [Escherichia coli]|nr:MBL fold metallo-hydrolase [Escherichia coli]
MREVAVSLIRAGHCVHPQRATIRDGSWRPTIFPALSVLLV